jgi:uncharacterized protein (UPF0335 family)
MTPSLPSIANPNSANATPPPVAQTARSAGSGERAGTSPSTPFGAKSTEPDMTVDANLDAGPDILNPTAQGRLRSIIERVERLEEDKAAVQTDIKEVFAEAKGEGYDVKVLRIVIRKRKQDKAKRQEEEAIEDLYMSALGEA